MRIQQATLTAAATLTSVASPLAMVVGAILFAAHAAGLGRPPGPPRKAAPSTSLRNGSVDAIPISRYRHGA